MGSDLGEWLLAIISVYDMLVILVCHVRSSNLQEGVVQMFNVHIKQCASYAHSFLSNDILRAVLPLLGLWEVRPSSLPISVTWQILGFTCIVLQKD